MVEKFDPEKVVSDTRTPKPAVIPLTKEAAATVTITPTVTGSNETFEEIFDRFERPIYNYVLRLMGGNEQDAEEITQESFIKALVALPRMPKGLIAGPWVYRIATNTCLDELRRRRLIKFIPWDTFTAVFHPKQVDTAYTPEQVAIRAEEIRETNRNVNRVLQRLSPRYRAALLLKEKDGLSCEDIGNVFGISEGAAKHLLFHAREKYRRVSQELELKTA